MQAMLIPASGNIEVVEVNGLDEIYRLLKCCRATLNGQRSSGDRIADAVGRCFSAEAKKPEKPC